MLESLNRLPADPILGLMQLFREDTNPQKVDLGVGVFKNEAGQTPIMAAVTQAEQHVIAEQTTKSYVGPAGNQAFLTAMAKLTLGEFANSKAPRIASAQTPGGCGALRVAAEAIKAANPKATVWVSNPTWGNHEPLLGNAGLALKKYPYLNRERTGLDWLAMQSAINEVKRGDVVLLHASCHNPTGVDLNFEQWQWLADKALEIGFVPFVDMAYQGFGGTLEEDAKGLQWLVAHVPEVLLAVSCSKNFGLYKERVGMVLGLCANESQKIALQSHLLSIVRGIYSMPPDHGAAIVAKILNDKALEQLWRGELDSMRGRIAELRLAFTRHMAELGHPEFTFVTEQRGMFSYLGITEPQVAWLAKNKSIYLLSSSRASIAGLTQGNLKYVCSALAEALASA